MWLEKRIRSEREWGRDMLISSAVLKRRLKTNTTTVLSRGSRNIYKVGAFFQTPFIRSVIFIVYNGAEAKEWWWLIA